MTKRNLILTILALSTVSFVLLGCGKKQKDELEQEAAARAMAEKAAQEAQAEASKASTAAKAAETALDNAEAKLRKVNDKLKETTETLKKVETQRNALQAQVADMDKLKAEMDKISGQLNETKSKLEAIVVQRDQLQMQVKQLQKQHQQAVKKAEDMQSKNQMLQQELEELKKKLASKGKHKKTMKASDYGADTGSEANKYSAASEKKAQKAKTDLPQPGNMFSFDVSLDYFSHYVWRGQELNESVFQPGFSVSYEGLTASFWGSVDLTDAENHAGEFTEMDWSLDYTMPCPVFENAEVSFGVIYYNFGTQANNNQGGLTKDTTELYWGMSFDAPFNPYFTVYHDVDEADGSYVSVGVSHTWEDVIDLTEDTAMDVELLASLGWGSSSYNQYYWGVDDSAVNDLNISIGMPFEMMGWTVRPSMNWTMVVDNKLRDTNTSAFASGYDDTNNYFYVGVGLSKSF